MAIQTEKWKELIDQIREEHDLSQKVDLLATLLFSIVNNDLVCLERAQIETRTQIDKCMKKIYTVGAIIAVLLFSGVNIKTIIDFAMTLVK